MGVRVGTMKKWLWMIVGLMGMDPVLGQMPAPVPDGITLSAYREQYQGAFTLLIPGGWRADGGMIPSGVDWNVVDLVETNIRFRVTSPDGRSFFGWYPRFNFQDPAVTNQSSMGILNIQPGQVLNGCWQYPYMGVADYVRIIVLGQLSAQEFQSARILGPAYPSPELRAWVPAVATRSECGYVNFEAVINGVPSYGRIYAIIYDMQGLIWTTVGCFGLVAPKDRWHEDERTMELCLRSFRLDPVWVQKASAAIAARGQQYNDTIRYLNQVDNEINRNRSQARSDMQTEVYKVLTDQMETRDPQSGKEYWMPAYKRAFTDGRGNYFLTDQTGPLPIEQNPEWRTMDIINRNQ